MSEKRYESERGSDENGGSRSVDPLVGHICDGGWTTVKCCNLCGMPMTGESWEIPFVAAVQKLEQQWAREIANRNNISWSELDQARGYELRERHLALREIIENFLPNSDSAEEKT